LQPEKQGMSNARKKKRQEKTSKRGRCDDRRPPCPYWVFQKKKKRTKKGRIADARTEKGGQGQ